MSTQKKTSLKTSKLANQCRIANGDRVEFLDRDEACGSKSENVCFKKKTEKKEENEYDPEKHKTVAFDPRFPNCNQTYHCYSAYLDYHRACNLLGEESDAAKYFKRVYTIMCPNFWIEEWDDMRANGTFPARINRVQIERKTRSRRPEPPPPSAGMAESDGMMETPKNMPDGETPGEASEEPKTVAKEIKKGTADYY